MSLENIFPNKEQFDTMNTLLASIASNTGSGIKVNTFHDVQQLTRFGLAQKVFGVAEQFVAEKETSVVAGIGDSTGITGVTVDPIAFINALGTAHEELYEAHFDGAVWHKENEENIILSDYGITVTGTAAKGDHITITVKTSKLNFDIVDFNKHTPRNSKHTNTIDLLLHDVATYGTIPFSAAQLLAYFKDGLPAGTYKVTFNHSVYGNNTGADGVYMFTLTQAIPAGGGFRHSKIGAYGNNTQASVIGNNLVTYNAVTATSNGAAIETVAFALWDEETECVDLGTFTSQNRSYYTEDISVVIDGTTYTGKRNFTERNAYGSNRWKTSVYRQWLNSAAPAVASGSTTISNWWTKQSVFDRVPGGANSAGFLYGLDPDFVNSLGEVEVKTALHTCDRSGSDTYEITYDKVFLLSRTEVFGSNEYSGIAEGSLLEYFNGATNADRIKYQGTAARYWWLRTPYSGTACVVRNVGTDGALGNYYAGSAHGVVPACCII